MISDRNGYASVRPFLTVLPPKLYFDFFGKTLVRPLYFDQKGSAEVVAEKNLTMQKQWATPWGANMSALAV